MSFFKPASSVLLRISGGLLIRRIVRSVPGFIMYFSVVGYSKISVAAAAQSLVRKTCGAARYAGRTFSNRCFHARSGCSAASLRAFAAARILNALPSVPLSCRTS